MAARPRQCSFAALDGYEHVRALQHRLNQRINLSTELLGLLPTRYRSGTAHAHAALAEIQQQVKELHVPLHFAPIRLAVAAADAPAQGMTLADLAPAAPITQEYRRITEQIMAFLEGQRWYKPWSMDYAARRANADAAVGLVLDQQPGEHIQQVVDNLIETAPTRLGARSVTAV